MAKKSGESEPQMSFFDLPQEKEEDSSSALIDFSVYLGEGGKHKSKVSPVRNKEIHLELDGFEHATKTPEHMKSGRKVIGMND